METYDVIIIGGGPAGLNAAVVLGRSRRRVVLFDTGSQRNRFSDGMRNYLTRDNIEPAEFLRIANRELRKYGVIHYKREIISAKKDDAGFEVADDQRKVYRSKKLLIATGLRDNVPALPGIEAFYGKSVVHCPYCDAWEVKDKRLGVYARNKNGFELAMSLLTWSDRVTLFTDGKNYLKPIERQSLLRRNVNVVPEKILRLEGNKSRLTNVLVAGGNRHPCDALFFTNGYEQQCSIAESLGCKMNTKGVVITTRLQQTDIPGLYVAGDVAKDMHFVVVAAAEGAKAGVSINKELQREDLISFERQLAQT
ncbi:MAG TPA: NAD(P)/FAD-dependent oxidoreductase [Chitinophagaceae bacterium]|jgi:thioredoxin reductase